MTSQRARAYARVMVTLRDLGPAKLLPAEQSRIRLAADTLLFCADLLGDASARTACADADELCAHLARSGRWMPQRADALFDDLWACGPGHSSSLAAAA
jgi:hypothetical protein